MSLKIHALVQNADNFNFVGHETEEEDMNAHGIFSVTRANVVAGAPFGRIVGHGLYRCANLQNIAVSLMDVPMIGGVVPDLPQIGARSPR
jgi:hypothetical protein